MLFLQEIVFVVFDFIYIEVQKNSSCETFGFLKPDRFGTNYFSELLYIIEQKSGEKKDQVENLIHRASTLLIEFCRG